MSMSMSTSKLISMKTLSSLLLSTLLCCAFLLCGCGQSGGSGGTMASVDASPIEKAFASAEPALKGAAEKVTTALKSGSLTSALPDLQQLAANAKLTDDQKKAISDVLAKVQKAIADAGSKAAGEAGKAAGDVQKSLGK